MEGVTQKVGGELHTFFWTDPWLGGIPLCETLLTPKLNIHFDLVLEFE
jgi:hypothetical protein